jgi:hypothetical protein
MGLAHQVIDPLVAEPLGFAAPPEDPEELDGLLPHAARVSAEAAASAPSVKTRRFPSFLAGIRVMVSSLLIVGNTTAPR